MPHLPWHTTYTHRVHLAASRFNTLYAAPRLCTVSFCCWNVPSHPLCLTSSTGLQVQLKFHSFQDNFPSYLLRSELDTPEPVFLSCPSTNSLSAPCPMPHLPPLPPARTHISIRAERMCTFLPRSGPQPQCPEPTCFVRLRESIRELKTCPRWLQTIKRIYEIEVNV